MDNNIDNLKKFIERIKIIGFFERLFNWKNIRYQLVDAATDLQKLITNSENLKNHNTKLESENSALTTDLRVANDKVTRQESEIAKFNSTIQENNSNLTQFTKDLATRNTTIESLEARITALDTAILLANQKNTDLQTERDSLKQQNTKLLAEEEARKREHFQQAVTLQKFQESIQSSREKEIQAVHNAEIERLNNLKLTWTNHQENVKQVVKSLCGKHTIEYLEKVPFKGEPDNTLKICDEFVIFDAKSPRGEDLTNFPSYIKEQSEKAKKYAKEENVKKWIFFVVPSNTMEVIKTFVYPLADYDIFVVTLDSLEPIILSLKKIEEYDFADKLNPEDRENICRVLGKFAHLSKRRIQIDTYFINQFMELAYKCESDLPSDFLERVIEFEKVEKLNPPQEKRIKAISTTELEKSTKKLRIDAIQKGILIEDDKITIGLNELPLYKPEPD